MTIRNRRRVFQHLFTKLGFRALVSESKKRSNTFSAHTKAHLKWKPYTPSFRWKSNSTALRGPTSQPQHSVIREKTVNSCNNIGVSWIKIKQNYWISHKCSIGRNPLRLFFIFNARPGCEGKIINCHVTPKCWSSLSNNLDLQEGTSIIGWHVSAKLCYH